MDLDELRERALESADAADKVRDEHVDALDELQQLEIDVARNRALNYHSLGEEVPEHQDLGEFDPRVYVARRKVKFKAAELATLDQRDIEATKAFSDAVAANHEKQLAREHEASEHWHRRFHTSLAIANGGAFLAIASHVFDKDASQAAIKVSFWVLALFSLGLLAGGAIPLILAREVDGANRVRAQEQMGAKRRQAENLAILSALLFALGVGGALAAIWSLGHPKHEPNPATAAKIKRGSPPTSPGRPAVPRPPSLPQKPAPQPQRSGPLGVDPQRTLDRTGDHG